MGTTSCNNVALPYFYIRIFTGGGLQFRRISAVAQKYFDALPCFSHDNHAMLFINCKYISINPNVPCLNVILTNSMKKLHFLINCTAMFTLARFEVLLITQTKVFVKHTALIDKCNNKRKIM